MVSFYTLQHKYSFFNSSILVTIGKICSGGFSPSLKHPIAMAYVSKENSKIGTPLFVKAGKTTIPVQVASMPFVPTQYKLK